MYSPHENPQQHMYSFGMGLNKSYMGTGRDSSSRGPHPDLDARNTSPTPSQPRRRSHRPRGCRGGRKNRKNRETKAAAASPGGPVSGVLAPSIKSQTTNTGSIQNSPAKGDLSHFQHVNTGKAWGKQPVTKEISPMKRQMLPPPLPPFVGGNDPFIPEDQKHQNHSHNARLKMLPSFDDHPELKTFLSAPVSSTGLLKAPSQQPLDLSTLFTGSDVMTIGTLVSTSSSGSEDDFVCHNNISNNKNQRIEMQRQQQLESGSLFVTSPRSFLLGAVNQTGSSGAKPKISVW